MALALGIRTASAQLPRVEFDGASSSGPEPLTRVFFPVVLSAPTSAKVSVRYEAVGGDAGPGLDYSLPPGTLAFAPSQTLAVIWMTVINDRLIEPEETVVIRLSAPVNATLGGLATHTYLILDDDRRGTPLPRTPSVGFASLRSSVDENCGTASVTVALSFAYTGTVSVAYRVTGGTATGGGTDYLLPEGTLSLAPSQTVATMFIPVVNDRLAETNETIHLALTNVTGATYGSNLTHTVEILDDDLPEVFFLTSTSTVSEGAGSLSLPVALSQPCARTATVSCLFSGSATRDADYTVPVGPLIFAPGQTNRNLALKILEDHEIELNETIHVTLTSPLNLVLGSNFAHGVTVTDNDIEWPLVGFDARFSSGPESQSEAAFTVKVDRVGTADVKVSVSVGAESTATGLGVDYAVTNTAITIPAGQREASFSLNIFNDARAEADESVVLNLINPVHARLDRITSHTYWIQDDDREFGDLTLFKQNVRTVDNKNLRVVGPLVLTANLRGLGVDGAGNLFISDQGPNLRPEEGGLLMSPSNSIKAVRLLSGLTQPADVELTPDERGFVVSGPDGKLTVLGFGISLRIPNIDVLGRNTAVHVLTDLGEKVQTASPDGYFHILDLLVPGQKSKTVTIVVEHGGVTKQFHEVPLGRPGTEGNPKGHRIMELNF